MIKKEYVNIRYTYLLDEEEAELVKNCLQYVKHRQEKHNKCNHISKEKIIELLKNFNE